MDGINGHRLVSNAQESPKSLERPFGEKKIEMLFIKKVLKNSQNEQLNETSAAFKRVPLMIIKYEIAPNVTRVKVPSNAIGKKEWEECFGVDVGKEPPLPPDIETQLNAPCPIWPNKKVRETHLLTLIPETVNGKPLTLQLLGELVQKPLSGNATKWEYFYPGQSQSVKAESSHWVLMSRDVLPGSIEAGKPYQTPQQWYAAKDSLLASFQQQYPEYDRPSLIDAAASIFMEYCCHGNRLYSDSPQTWTQCKEWHDRHWKCCTGGFGGDGLSVSFVNSGICYDDGVGVARKVRF